MPLQTLVRANARRTILAQSAITMAQFISGHFSTCITLFMAALYKTRQRQAGRVIRQFRDLIDGLSGICSAILSFAILASAPEHTCCPARFERTRARMRSRRAHNILAGNA